MLTVVNASAAITLLEQRPEKIRALSGIRTHDLCDTTLPTELSKPHESGRMQVSPNPHFYDRSHVSLIAQLGEHCTGIAEVVGSNPAQSLNFFRSLF